MRVIKNKLLQASAGIALAAGLSMSAISSASAQSLDDLPKEQIEKLLHDYIMENPEVLVRSINEFYQEQEKQAATKQQNMLDEIIPTIQNSEDYPIGGNPEASVAMVEFFDYQCPYCKRVYPQIHRMMESDDDLKVVFIEYPILGPASVVASKAALAAKKQDKYLEFHYAMMGLRGKLTEERIMTVAESVKLDMDKLKADMESEDVAMQIQHNLQLAQILNVTGTPGFIIGEQIVRGAIDENAMKKAIEEERAKVNS